MVLWKWRGDELVNVVVVGVLLDPDVGHLPQGVECWLPHWGCDLRLHRRWRPVPAFPQVLLREGEDPRNPEPIPCDVGLTSNLIPRLSENSRKSEFSNELPVMVIPVPPLRRAQFSLQSVLHSPAEKWFITCSCSLLLRSLRIAFSFLSLATSARSFLSIVEGDEENEEDVEGPGASSTAFLFVASLDLIMDCRAAPFPFWSDRCSHTFSCL